jgi:hypothetical protein
VVKEASLILVMGGAEGLMEKAVISVEEGGVVCEVSGG